MLSVLRNGTYRRLFTAQVVALVGTGLATVALSLLAYDLAGAYASAVLGTALAIKMIAYVGIAPLIGALAGRIPRRTLMAAMDLTRAGCRLGPSVRHRGLAGPRPDLPAPGGVGRLHADVPGHRSRDPSRRTRLHPGPVDDPARL